MRHPIRGPRWWPGKAGSTATLAKYLSRQRYSGSAKSTTARGMNLKYVAWLHLNLSDVAHFIDRAIAEFFRSA